MGFSWLGDFGPLDWAGVVAKLAFVVRTRKPARFSYLLVALCF